jgi:KipI family sensor histidine kinase inhibitor
MNDPAITFCGDDALRLSAPDRDERLARARQLRTTGDWLEVVPGRRDVTVQFDPLRHTPTEALAHLSHTLATPAPRPSRTLETVELPVHFGGKEGPDLADISNRTGLSEAEVVSRLLSEPLQIDMLGFTPGFAYMSGLDDTIEIPRLLQPRQQVPAGSIGLITGQCGLYALAGPGGWPIIGRTPVSLFDPVSDNPFRLQPGMQVRLVDAAAS